MIALVSESPGWFREMYWYLVDVKAVASDERHADILTKAVAVVPFKRTYSASDVDNVTHL